VIKSTNQQDINDPNKITKPAKEEWDQMDTGLATYDQNGERNRAEKVRRTLSSGAIHCLLCPVEPDII
jgi:hypothetical protein